MHHRLLLSGALAWASLLRPAISRPYLDDVLVGIENPNSPANITIEPPSSSPVGLVRRSNDGRSLCRGLCNQVSWLGMADDTDASVEARGLEKRYLAQMPNNIDAYMVNKVDHLKFDILREVDWVGTSSGYRQFDSRPFTLGARTLCGCTVLTVVSEEAVYMGHFFESMAFTTSQEAPDLEDNFQTHCIDFINQNTPPATREERNLGLRGVANKFETGVRAFIMTPQREADAAVDQDDDENEDLSVTYLPGLNYEAQITQLKDEVKLILGGDTPVTVIQYQAINQDDPEMDPLLDTTAKGRTLFEYGGTRAKAGSDRARLWVESTVVWSWTYGQESGPLDPGANHVPLKRDIEARQQEDAGSPTVTSQAEQATQSPSITKVVIGQTTLTLGPTPSVVTISGSPVTLQSEAVVIANRTMSLLPGQNETVLTNQGMVLTLEKDSGSDSTSTTTDLTPSATVSTTGTTSAQTRSGISSVTVTPASTQNTLTGAASTQTYSITSTNPFPSTLFSLPPIVTITSTSTDSDGSAVVVTVTGTTDSSGVVVPVSTLSSAEASRSASSLVSQLSAVSSAVSAFSADPTNPAKATAAVNAIHDAQSSNNNFGQDLGIAAAGLCFIFCSTVAGAAGALGSLEAGVSGVIAGTASVGALGGLIGAVSAAAAALDDKSRNDQTAQNTSKQATKTSKTTSSYEPTTVTDFAVQCATGLVNGASTTTCSTVSTIVVTTCSATATTATTYRNGFCPLTRQSPGPIATYSYEGYQDLPVTTYIWLNATSTESTTASSTSMSTETSTLISTLLTTTDLTTTGLSTTLTTVDSTIVTGVSTQSTTSTGTTTGLTTSVEITAKTPTSVGTTTSAETTSLSTTSTKSTSTKSTTSLKTSTSSSKASTTSVKATTTSAKTTKTTKTTTTTTSKSTTSVKPACPSATKACTDCSGRMSNGKTTCRGGDLDGCTCNPSADTPGFSCGAQKSCELNNCDGSYSNGKATCQNAFKGCECTPSTNTPGFTCGSKKSCESNSCNGKYSNGKATCQNAFKGCECLPSADTPGFSCGSRKSCESNNCDGYYSNGKAYCTNAFKGCECKASKNTNGFSCGTAKSCELNGCGGTSDDNGNATCQNEFKGCKCLPSTDTPGFSCGSPKSCQSNGCNGKGSYSGGAYCQDAFKGCKCTPNSSTPGFCGSLGQCSFSGCNGIAVSGKQLGVCQTDSHKGCSCILSSQPTTLATQPSEAPQSGPSWVLRLWGDQTCKANTTPFLQQTGKGPSKCFETYGSLRSWCAPKDTWPSSLKVLFYDSEGCQGNPLASLTSSEKGCPGEIQAFSGCYEDDNLKSFQVVSA